MLVCPRLILPAPACVQERIEREMAEREEEEVRRLMEANLKGRKAQAMLSARDGAPLDKQALMQDLLSERTKEAFEAERKLQKAAKGADHLERAKREEEAPLLEAAWAARQVGRQAGGQGSPPDHLAAQATNAVDAPGSAGQCGGRLGCIFA